MTLTRSLFVPPATKINHLSRVMFKVKIYTFASLRQGLAEDPEFCLDMNRAYWDSGEELKSHIFHVLSERQSSRFAGQVSAKDYTLPEPRTIMLAINETFIEPGKSVQLSPMDIIALIPPVSGG